MSTKESNSFPRKGYTPGVLSYPVPLQLQCLLFIIGNITYQGDNVIPVSSLALLPRYIRYQLLLLLPAVDVCKLEGTPVTHDISMDEIWETIFKKRMPLPYQERINYFKVYFMTPCDFLKEKGIIVTWMEAYFNAALFFTQADSSGTYKIKDCYEHCKCTSLHCKHDLLYGIYRFDSTITELYRCFTDNTASIHGVTRCTQTCRTLTPVRYYDHYKSPTVTVHHVINLLAHHCNVFFKHANISLFGKVWKQCSQAHVIKLLKSVESLAIDTSISEDTKAFVLKIFADNQRLAIEFSEEKESSTNSSSISIIYPYLTGPNDIKHLNLYILNTSFTMEHFSQIFKRQKSLQKVKIHVQCFIDIYGGLRPFDNKEFVRCSTDLMLRPMFKELAFFCTPKNLHVSIDTLMTFLRQFFFSPHPVKLSLSLSCPEFDSLRKMYPVNIAQLDKSLELKDCNFSSNLVSFLPSHLALKSLTLTDNHYNTIKAFAKLTSIQLSDTFTFVGDRSANIDDVCLLFSIVTADKWNITVPRFMHNDRQRYTYNDRQTQQLLATSILSIKGTLTSFKYNMDIVSIPVLEAIFRSLSPSKPPYFLLEVRFYFHSDEKAIKTMYSIWKANGGVKLKSLLLIYSFDATMSADTTKSIISDMALDITIL